MNSFLEGEFKIKFYFELLFEILSIGLLSEKGKKNNASGPTYTCHNWTKTRIRIWIRISFRPDQQFIEKALTSYSWLFSLFNFSHSFLSLDSLFTQLIFLAIKNPTISVVEGSIPSSIGAVSVFW